MTHYTTGDCRRAACGRLLTEADFSSEAHEDITCAACLDALKRSGYNLPPQTFKV